MIQGNRMKIQFHKYHGTGNDFILIDNRDHAFNKYVDEDLLQDMCNRHLGIGADGLMLFEDSAKYDFNMRYFNPDGKEATMCGNGGRCITFFAHSIGQLKKKQTQFKAVDGIHHAEILETKQNQALVNLKMINVENITHHNNGYIIDTGSPHYIEFVKDVDNIEVVKEGRAIRHAPFFAEKGGINVNFVEIKRDGIFVRTYERGVENETLSCGTGATASAIAFIINQGKQIIQIPVKTKGGLLKVHVNEHNREKFSNIWLEGPANFIFKGEIEI